MIHGLYMDDDTGIRGLTAQASQLGIAAPRSDDLGMRGSTDIEHLRRATSEGLVLVTCNRRDFLALHWDFLTRSEEHAGIVVIDQDISRGERIRALLAFAQVAEPRDVVGRVHFLKDWLTL